ncbi:MAG: sigma-54-dependent Fis family transcriptional regulator [Deltaproteobacteria bacterium]|nr:sigma-54-dependent Fis family transcriptional regulator [Deltaproteobacteria bacterium]
MDEIETVLVIDDENGVRESFKMVLKSQYNVLLAETGQKGIEVFKDNAVDLILLDILLPDMNGIDLLERLKGMEPNVEIIMVSAVKEIPMAVKAMKLGAYDYITKPFVVEDIKNVVSRAIEKHSLIKEVTYLKDELLRYHPSKKIIGETKEMKDIFELINNIADSDGSVLIQGESGTGKELVARAIHSQGPRRDKPFVVINCAAIPETLMESELFGHTKGAFTGASRSKVGKLEIADRGVAFLDDVDTLDINMQAKLLRVIQEKEFERLGSTKIIRVDVRFIAASNKNLKKLVQKEHFREDLYYRLNVFPVDVPPLRKRKEDIPLLLDYCLKLQSQKTGKPLKQFSKNAMYILTNQYDWPGNVRELQNLVERLSTIVKDPIIRVEDISFFSHGKQDIVDLPLKEAVSAFEKQYIHEVLKKTHGNRTRAARLLGVHRNTLQNKLYGPSQPEQA